MKPCGNERLTDLFDLGEVAGFHTDLEVAAGDGHIGVGAFMVNADNVTAALRDNVADALQLTRLILQRDLQGGIWKVSTIPLW